MYINRWSGLVKRKRGSCEAINYYLGISIETENDTFITDKWQQDNSSSCHTDESSIVKDGHNLILIPVTIHFTPTND